MNIYKLFAFYLLFFSPVLFAEPVYKWIDEDGQVHYGNRPAIDNAKEVKIKDRYIDSGKPAKPLNAQERVSKQKKFLNALELEKKAVAERKKKKREQEEVKLMRCNASRDQFRRAKDAGALYDLDEKGNRILLNKKQYEQAMSQAKTRVEKWCN